ncbi:MAG: hypothetical protein HY315_04595 [Acidobacteria bacterium]|nr:hypothetical protein [Acidobacteriota bacterium]
MAKVERVSYFMADLDDKPGVLLKILQSLKAKNISLAGLWGFGTHGGKATLFVIARNPDKLRKAWSAGLLAQEGTGFFVTGADRTGALIATLKALAEKGVNIHAIDAVAVGGRFGSFIWVKAEDVERAGQALKA